MKKISLILAGVGMTLALGFTSCQKEEINKSEVERNNSEEVLKISSGHVMRFWYDDGDDNFGCRNEPGNCYEEVVVIASLSNIVDDIGDESDNFNTGKVVELLNENYADFSKYIPKETLDQVINDKSKLSVRGRIAKDGIAYMIFTHKGRIESVYPLTR